MKDSSSCAPLHSVAQGLRPGVQGCIGTPSTYAPVHRVLLGLPPQSSIGTASSCASCLGGARTFARPYKGLHWDRVLPAPVLWCTGYRL